MGTAEAAQAAELVRALRATLNDMTVRLDWLERNAVNRSGSMASAMRSKAATLRRDIDEAFVLINRLQRRYPSVDKSIQRPFGRRPDPP